MATLIYYPNMVQPFKEHPWLFGVCNNEYACNCKYTEREYSVEKDFKAFLSSAASIAALLILFAIGLFPNSWSGQQINPAYNLNIYNASSSQKNTTKLC